MIEGKLDAYRIFFAVAENRSFSRGAQQMFITQSAASQSVKNLEEALGVKLFLRGKREIALTAEGEMLYEYVKNALSLLERAEGELHRFKKLERGALRIAVSDTLSRYLLLPFLETFSRQYPMIHLNIVNRTSRDALELLKLGNVDLAFVNLPLEEEAVEMRPYRQVQDIFVAGSRFRFLEDRVVPLGELIQYPLIFLERASNSRRYVETFFLSKGIPLSPDIELGSHDLLLEFARFNLGISCVTREFAGQYLGSGALFEIQTVEKLPPRHVGVCTLKGVSVSPAGKAFLALIQQDEETLERGALDENAGLNAESRLPRKT